MLPAPIHLRPNHLPAPRGFTLAELIIALTLVSILAGATFVGISQAVRSRDASQAKAQAGARAHAAADYLVSALANALRDSDLTEARIAITRTGRTSQGADGLLLFSNLPRAVRPMSGQGEGGQGEVQFRLQPMSPSVAQPASISEPMQALWRRMAPVVDDYPDAGGVATQLVDGLRSLSIQASSGGSNDWMDVWDSDVNGLPHAVRLTIVATDDSAKQSVTVQRVVAIDRVAPPAEIEQFDADATGTGSASGTSPTSGGTTTGGANR